MQQIEVRYFSLLLLLLLHDSCAHNEFPHRRSRISLVPENMKSKSFNYVLQKRIKRKGDAISSASKSSFSLFTGGSTTSCADLTAATIPAANALAYNASSTDAGSLSMTDLFEKLDSTANGLKSQEATSRIAQYGRNIFDKPPKKSMLRLILEQFDDRLVQILLAVALLSGIFSFHEVLKSSADESLLKSFIEPIVICSILFLNAAVGVVQSSRANGSLETLQKLQPTLATVVRDGECLSEKDASELVPGDIIEIRVGDKIPADARLLSLQTASLQVDEGTLTGESVTVSKLPGDEGTALANLPIQDQRGMLYSGTMVTRGSGRAIVVQTGMDTQFGKIQKGVTAATNDEVKTPLEIKLDEFGNTIAKIIGAICILVWIVSVPKFNDPSFASVFDGAVYYAKVAVALGVAAIPEGLPAVITLCLSLGARRMAERNVIVRKLKSVETLGCTSVICTDKTGTLTTNEMTAVKLLMVEKKKQTKMDNKNKGGEYHYNILEHQISGLSYSPVGDIEGIQKHTDIQNTPNGALADVAAVCALCNDAKIVVENGDGNSANEKTTYRRIGEPTEAALYVLAEKVGGMSPLHSKDGHKEESESINSSNPGYLVSENVDEWRKTNPREATLEFSRDRKSMSVLCSKDNSRSRSNDRSSLKQSTKCTNRLLVKGAPNLLLERCTYVKFRDGTVEKLSAKLREAIEKKISEFASTPLRCIALAVKEQNLPKSLKSFKADDHKKIATHPLLSDPSTYKDVESGLTFVGVVGIKDPARPGVAESIDICTKAGIRVIMITGDAKDTAVAIATDVNIFSNDIINEEQGQLPSEKQQITKMVSSFKAFEGREFFQKSKTEQLDIINNKSNIVFCRAEPSDKQKIVKMLQDQNEIPAMTGDGVNDAPALKQAAIGVAMGIAGTEVAKEAADMIIADDDFSTIVSAVEEGRRIYANIQSFICFLISCNIGEICAIFFATIAGFPEPLTAMHLLWVNLVTDGPPATALGFNPPAPDLMDKPPRPTDQPILTNWLLTRYILTGLYVGFATIGIFVGHYLSQGVTLSQLSSWSKCGTLWTPLDGKKCSDLVLGNGRVLPQTLALTTLVCMEMIKALSAVSLENSIFKVGPQSNPWLLLGVGVPFLLHLFVLYSSKFSFPGLGESLGLVPLSADDWINVLKWSAPILLVDEILKFTGRWLEKKEVCSPQKNSKA